MGTSLFTFCKSVVGEVLAVGRCGTLIDWAGSTGGPIDKHGESRTYVVRYQAEDILNWQTQRIKLPCRAGNLNDFFTGSRLHHGDVGQ